MARLSHEERRRRIVLGAMEAFSRSGFRGTRSRDLARAAGVSEALLFKHFPDKRAIQTAIIEERIRQRGGRFIPAELRDAPPEKVLKALASRILANSRRDPGFMRLLYFAGLESEPLGPMFFRRRVSRSVDELADLARLWIKKGKVRKSIDPRGFAWSFLGCIFQLAAVRELFGVTRVSGRRSDPAALVSDLFHRGIRA